MKRTVRQQMTDTKPVVVKMTIEYVIDVPETGWGSTKPDIEFTRNDGCWCNQNDLSDLVDSGHDETQNGHCGCFSSHIEYLREATAEDLKHLPAVFRRERT